LALGDTSYPLYCKTGEDMDEQFEKLGGVRIAPMQKCDVEYEEDANAWFNEVMEKLSSPKIGISQNDVQVNIVPVITKKSGKQTYSGDVLTKINLNDRGSSKETWHIEIAAEGVEYLCGDSIGIVPENPSKIVDEILNIVGIDPSKIVNFKNEAFIKLWSQILIKSLSDLELIRFCPNKTLYVISLACDLLDKSKLSIKY
jgi:sulfite reductase (NADPH) flavoprotein alpha-component